jgi:hypothetical protein
MVWVRSVTAEIERAARITLVAVAALAQHSSAAALGPIQETRWTEALGRGFDSRLGSLTNTCVTGQIEYRGNRSGEIQAHYNESFSDYLSTTQGRLSGGVDLLLVGGSASVDYFARVARTELSTSYTLHFRAKLGSAVLGRRALSAAGTAAAAASSSARRVACGDEFISQADLGSELLISVGFHFTDASELQRFVNKVTVKALFGLVKSTKRWTEETSEFSQTGYVQINVLQSGGEPSRLAAVFGSASPSLCRFSAVEACRNMLIALLRYANSADGFSAQFANPYRPEQLMTTWSCRRPGPRTPTSRRSSARSRWSSRARPRFASACSWC